MCNTREENAAELAREQATPVVPITREELIDKLTDDYIDTSDRGGLWDDVKHGRVGLVEYTNEELEELVELWVLTDDDGNEVRYTITDPCPIKATPEDIKQELLEALKLLLRVPETLTTTDHFDYMSNAERIARAAIAKAEGRAK